jgi:hypothetical protein
VPESRVTLCRTTNLYQGYLPRIQKETELSVFQSLRQHHSPVNCTKSKAALRSAFGKAQVLKEAMVISAGATPRHTPYYTVRSGPPYLVVSSSRTPKRMMPNPGISPVLTIFRRLAELTTTTPASLCQFQFRFGFVAPNHYQPAPHAAWDASTILLQSRWVL